MTERQQSGTQCRVCSDNVGRYFLDNIHTDRELAREIERCFGIEILPDDQGSHRMCYSCFEQFYLYMVEQEQARNGRRLPNRREG